MQDFPRPILRPLAYGGGLLCTAAVAGLLWLNVPVGGSAAATTEQSVGASATSGNGFELFESTEIVTGSSERRAIVSALLRSGHDEALLPLRPDFDGDVDFSASAYAARFHDPTESGVPLQWVADQSERWLTPGFRMADFTARDGAPMARISPSLVNGLERLRRAAGDIVIISGYRHPSHNQRVGGAGDSQHQAGKAADIYAPGLTTTELALLALETMGCSIGLGLGANSIHVDVRGELTTWTYHGAPLNSATFATLVRTQCGLPISESLAARAADAWLDEPVVQPIEEFGTATAGRPGGEGLLGRFQDQLLTAAAEAYGLYGPGAVVLDRRVGAPSAAPYYLPAGDPAIRDLGVESLVDFCVARADAGYFTYVILTDLDFPLSGVMSLGAVSGSSRRTMPSQPAAAPPVHEDHAPASDDRWVIVVASSVDEAGALQQQTSFAERLQPFGRNVAVMRGDDRFRVVVGPFDSQTAASSTLRQLQHVMPRDSWLMSL